MWWHSQENGICFEHVWILWISAAFTYTYVQYVICYCKDYVQYIYIWSYVLLAIFLFESSSIPAPKNPWFTGLNHWDSILTFHTPWPTVQWDKIDSKRLSDLRKLTSVPGNEGRVVDRGQSLRLGIRKTELRESSQATSLFSLSLSFFNP